MTTRSTSASAASAFRSGISAPKRAATTLERTTIDALADNDVAMASRQTECQKVGFRIGPQNAERQDDQTRERVRQA